MSVKARRNGLATRKLPTVPRINAIFLHENVGGSGAWRAGNRWDTVRGPEERKCLDYNSLFGQFSVFLRKPGPAFWIFPSETVYRKEREGGLASLCLGLGTGQWPFRPSGRAAVPRVRAASWETEREGFSGRTGDFETSICGPSALHCFRHL